MSNSLPYDELTTLEGDPAPNSIVEALTGSLFFTQASIEHDQHLGRKPQGPTSLLIINPNFCPLPGGSKLNPQGLLRDDDDPDAAITRPGRLAPRATEDDDLPGEREEESNSGEPDEPEPADQDALTTQDLCRKTDDRIVKDRTHAIILHGGTNERERAGPAIILVLHHKPRHSAVASASPS